MSAISVQEIANFELLKGLTDEERASFSKRLTEKLIPARGIIFHEGDDGGPLYFLITGDVEISQALTLPMSRSGNYDSRDKSIVQLSGETCPVFGEVSIFSNENKRTATVKALTNCRLGLLEEKDFFQILVNKHEIGYKVMLNLTRIVCGRLTTANKNVLKLTTALSLLLEK